ncbi:MAG: cytochrome c1 [Rhodospirillaceae bacterium]|jgi:ubiquinol-cytochrome c reductase cytochrome c1 subunit
MIKTITAIFTAFLLSIGTAQAAGDAPKPPKQDWSFNGIFGHYDRASAQRGFQVYKNVCAACHSLNYVYYRHLSGIGLTEAQIKAIAAEAEVTDGPNDAGEMFKRKGLPKDRYAAPFPNEQAARSANNGAYPPDLSLMVKARHGGADYLYALLTGYGKAPSSVKMMEGMNYNKYFPGHQIAMVPPLAADAVEYADGTKATVSQMAQDVTMFLSWAASPEMEERKRLGIKVLLFLLVLAGMLLALKRQVWSDIHK